MLPQFYHDCFTKDRLMLTIWSHHDGLIVSVRNFIPNISIRRSHSEEPSVQTTGMNQARASAWVSLATCERMAKYMIRGARWLIARLAS
jgi:hypothetical protein